MLTMILSIVHLQYKHKPGLYTLVISENIIEISCEPVGLAGTFELPKTSDKQNFLKPCKIF